MPELALKINGKKTELKKTVLKFVKVVFLKQGYGNKKKTGSCADGGC